MPIFSLIVATRGRSAILGVALASFARQILKDFEVIIVDQNPAGFLEETITSWQFELDLIHIHVPELSGLSLARNVGLEHATGTYVCFPDDDCTYPPTLLAEVLQLFETIGMEILTGRAADETGRTINGRFLTAPTWIDRSNAFMTQIEWMAFYRRSAVSALGGFDQLVGVGAKTPWQSSEGPELMLRALKNGFRAYYTPALFGHHPELDIVMPNANLLKKARGYGRGMGYVMVKHRLPIYVILNFLIRPMGATLLFLLRGRIRRSLYYWNTFVGRTLGCADALRVRQADRSVT